MALSVAYTVVANPHQEPKGQACPVPLGSPAGVVPQAAVASCLLSSRPPFSPPVILVCVGGWLAPWQGLGDGPAKI